MWNTSFKTIFIKVNNVDKHKWINKAIIQRLWKFTWKINHFTMYLGTLDFTRWVAHHHCRRLQILLASCYIEFTWYKVSSRIPFYVFGLRIHKCFVLWTQLLKSVHYILFMKYSWLQIPWINLADKMEREYYT